HARVFPEDREVGGPAAAVQFADRGEVADVVPVEVAGYYGEPPRGGGGLGDGVVDGDAGEGRPDPVDDLGPLRGVPCGGDLLDAGEQVGVRLTELLKEHVGAGDEHARVPQVVTVGDVTLRELEVGLLGEL